MARFNLKRWFKQRANVFYKETSGDGRGGLVNSWVRKYYMLPCRVFDSSRSVQYTIEEQGINYPVEKKLLCDVNIEINKGDKVDVDDVQYIVLRSTKPQANQENHTACLLGRIEEGRADE